MEVCIHAKTFFTCMNGTHTVMHRYGVWYGSATHPCNTLTCCYGSVMEVVWKFGMKFAMEICYGSGMEVCYGSLLWKWYGNLVWKCNPPMQHVKLHLHFRNPALNWKENYFWRYTLLKWNEKNFTNTMHAKWVGLARTMHVRCIQFTVFFCRDLIIYTVNI